MGGGMMWWTAGNDVGGRGNDVVDCGNLLSCVRTPRRRSTCVRYIGRNLAIPSA